MLTLGRHVTLNVMISSSLPSVKLGGLEERARKNTVMSIPGRQRRQPIAGLSVRQLRMRITSDDPTYQGLKKIKMSGKELARLPANLFKLTELQVLDLSPEREACLFYHLTEIPSQICNLCNLTVLAIDTNRLTCLPDELGQLHSLERLAVSNNHLSHLPPSFSSLSSLQSLYCSNNKFDHLPTAVCQIKSLRFLDFSDNDITDLPGGGFLLSRFFI